MQHTCTVTALSFNSDLLAPFARNEFWISLARVIYEAYLETAAGKQACH